MVAAVCGVSSAPGGRGIAGRAPARKEKPNGYGGLVRGYFCGSAPRFRAGAEALERRRCFRRQLRRERVQSVEAEVGVLALAVLARRDALRLHLLVADHQRVRNLHQLRVADLRAQLLRRLVQLDAKPALLELGEYFPRPVHVPVRHGDDACLDGRQPDREVAGEMLDQYADEPLEAAVDGAAER